MNRCELRGFAGDLCRTQVFCFYEQYFFEHEPAIKEPDQENAITWTRDQLQTVSKAAGCPKRWPLAQRLSMQLDEIQKRQNQS